MPNGWRGITFPPVPYVVSKGGKQHPWADWIAAGVHIVPVVCCQRREGSVWTWLLSSDCIEVWAICHTDWIACQGWVLKVMMKWHLYSASWFFSFPQNLSYRICQKEKAVSFFVFKRHMGFSVRRKRNLVKTAYSYSSCHSWDLIPHCVYKDSTAVPPSINASK